MLTIIYTEDMNRELIEMILDEKFKGYSILEQTGTWGKKREKSLQIQIVNADQDDVKQAVGGINVLNCQECCMIINIPCTTTFL